MKIPEKVRICGVDFDVIKKPFVRNGNDICYGKINFDNSVIELSEADGAEHQRQCITFLHEVCHGIINALHSGEEIENEELVCKILGKGLYQVLQDNGRKLFDIIEVNTNAKN